MHDLDGVEPRMSSPLAEFPNQDYLFEDLVVTWTTFMDIDKVGVAFHMNLTAQFSQNKIQQYFFE